MTTIKLRKYSIDQIIEIIATLEIDDKVKLWQSLEKDIRQSQLPCLKTAGIFKEDPLRGRLAKIRQVDYII